MGIFRTNNPLEYDDLDGIVIDDRAPSPSIIGVGTGVAILVGQFQRGPIALTKTGNTQAFEDLYGKGFGFSGNVALANKKWSELRIVRVIADDGVLATLSLSNDTVPSLKFDFKGGKGAAGNLITVLVEAGTVTGQKYTITDTNPNFTIPPEVFDNIKIANVAADKPFQISQLIIATVLDVTTEPVVAVAAPLATGDDGTVVDTDYEDALANAEGQDAGDIIFLDVYNQIRNGFLKTHIGLTVDKIGILAGGENDSPSTTETAVALLRDSAGRLIYAENFLETTIDGIPTFTSPASWYTSILSNSAPNIDPADVANTGFLFGVSGIKNDHSRNVYKSFMAQGVSSFEFDKDVGFKVKSGVVTQIVNRSKITVLRRRMTDFLTVSMAKFFKAFQNGPNRRTDRVAMKGAMLSFIEDDLEKNGILPKDSEVIDGKAKLIDIDSLNTNDTLAAGKNLIKYRQRLFSSMRFIVLVAEIGESVVVTEGEE